MPFMAKKPVQAYVDLPTIKWMDRQISKGFLASYSHSINLGLKLLKKSLHTTIKFKAPNSTKNAENAENGRRDIPEK